MARAMSRARMPSPVLSLGVRRQSSTTHMSEHLFDYCRGRRHNATTGSRSGTPPPRSTRATCAASHANEARFASMARRSNTENQSGVTRRNALWNCFTQPIRSDMEP